MGGDFWHDPITLVVFTIAGTLAATFAVERWKAARAQAAADEASEEAEQRTTEAIIHDLDRFVLPHFMPTDGSFDMTLPVRTERLEVRISQHLIDEEAGARVTNTRLGSIESALDELKAR